MSSSSIPTLKRNLQSLLAARTALHDVTISWGPPLPNTPREYISLGDVVGDQDWATVGGLTRLFRSDLALLVSVLREGQEQQAATERAFALLAEVESAVRADQTVGGAVLVAGVGGRIDLVELPSPDGMRRGAQVTAQIHCMTHI
jgi:hypothetical protein